MSVPGAADGDDVLSQFVRPDLDAKELIRAAVRNDTVSDDLAQLRQGINVLENQLREQVVSHHGRLIEQVSQAKDLEALTDTVTNGVARLQVTANCLPGTAKANAAAANPNELAPIAPVPDPRSCSCAMRALCRAGITGFRSCLDPGTFRDRAEAHRGGPEPAGRGRDPPRGGPRARTLREARATSGPR